MVTMVTNPELFQCSREEKNLIYTQSNLLYWHGSMSDYLLFLSNFRHLMQNIVFNTCILLPVFSFTSLNVARTDSNRLCWHCKSLQCTMSCHNKALVLMWHKQKVSYSTGSEYDYVKLLSINV